jgi:hypothetical protein
VDLTNLLDGIHLLLALSNIGTFHDPTTVQMSFDIPNLSRYQLLRQSPLTRYFGVHELTILWRWQLCWMVFIDQLPQIMEPPMSLWDE